MALYSYPSSSKAVVRSGLSEFEILRASHKFLREDGVEEKGLSWDERLAKKYYDNLYREFAVCDLKHYKSGNFSLRWRTESEVISGAGETTCGNTRCPFHSERVMEEEKPSLNTLELPFSYVEDSENKFALVKVVLCPKCTKKLMWKRNKEKELQEREQLRLEEMGAGPQRPHSAAPTVKQEHDEDVGKEALKSKQGHGRGKKERKRHQRRMEDYHAGYSRRRSSRSRSPRRPERLDHETRHPLP